MPFSAVERRVGLVPTALLFVAFDQSYVDTDLMARELTIWHPKI
jgi:hypothetical protein